MVCFRAPYASRLGGRRSFAGVFVWCAPLAQRVGRQDMRTHVARQLEIEIYGDLFGAGHCHLLFERRNLEKEFAYHTWCPCLSRVPPPPPAQTAWTTRRGFSHNISALLRGLFSPGCYILMLPADCLSDRRVHEAHGEWAVKQNTLTHLLLLVGTAVKRDVGTVQCYVYI